MCHQLDDVRSGVNSLSDDTDPPSDEDDDPLNPEQPCGHDSFIFGYRSASLDLAPFHPPPAHILRLWQIYQNNVEPALKVLHVPTVDGLFRNLSAGAAVSPREEPLVFTIYFAAIVSLEDDEVRAPLLHFSSPFHQPHLAYRPLTPPSAKPILAPLKPPS